MNADSKQLAGQSNTMPWLAAIALSCVVGFFVTLLALIAVGLVVGEVEHRHTVDLPNWPFLLVWASAAAVAAPGLRRL